MDTTYDDVARLATLSGGQKIYSFHRSSTCYGDVCPVHKPSSHDLRAFPLHYNFEVASFFREVRGKMVIDPDDYNLNNYGKVIVENSAICNACGVKLISTHRHDFVQCGCGQLAVDGGSSYLRRVGNGNFTDTSVVHYK